MPGPIGIEKAAIGIIHEFLGRGEVNLWPQSSSIIPGHWRVCWNTTVEYRGGGSCSPELSSHARGENENRQPHSIKH